MKMGQTADEIKDMVEEFAASQIEMPDSVQVAVSGNDAKTILDWLGSPVDEGKLTSEAICGLTMLLITVLHGHKELASLLLQLGVVVNSYDSGRTPILLALMTKAEW